ncbi:hypothetical protein QN277_024400 [Acacia crassicarpa]|uniref:DUF4283 domain-containing protein n=1 Tax=Acacia crassicarpa TaxID=499986 RepID=A0AAE1JF54_9FABA|nr:hypothetical protein QN277_024400 [Acacia crassicarpa]
MEFDQTRRVSSKKQVVLTFERDEMKQGNMLVGKLITGKNMNIPTIVGMIKKGWQVDKELEIIELDRNQLLFLFRFSEANDYKRILKGRSWSILGHLLSIQSWDEGMVLKDVNFDLSPFWVQFHGLPLENFNCSNAKILGDTVGETMMIGWE